MRRVLVTGAAGFIGFHVCRRLIAAGDCVAGLDNLNDYYDVGLKQARLRQLRNMGDFAFCQGDITSEKDIERAFGMVEPSIVVNLAAQAGVRYSLEKPQTYIQSNLVGFANILEACRHRSVEHLVYASSSSVYGANKKMPFSVKDGVDHPMSLYAASKKANELMAHAYSHLFELPTTGLRFFSVYGPWGRPDMALYIFTKTILEGTPIPVFNHGKMRRNFTYIDDVVEGIVRVMAHRPTRDDSLSAQNAHPGISQAAYRVYNVGNDQPVDLLDFIGVIERCLGKQARLEFLPMQPGDVPATYADIADLQEETGYRPSTPIEEGVARFVEWYRDYHAKSREQDIRLAA